MLTLELEVEYPDEGTSRAVLSSLDPDNAGYVGSELRGSKLIFHLSSGSAGTLRNTADDLMACLKAAEEACGVTSGRFKGRSRQNPCQSPRPSSSSRGS